MRWDLRWCLKLYREEQFLMEVGMSHAECIINAVYCWSNVQYDGQMWYDLVLFPVIGPSVLSADNQNAWVMTQ